MLTGKKILITGAMGLSGLSAARLCLRLGAEVFLSDKNNKDPLPPDLKLFEHTLHDLRPADGPEILERVHPDFIITAPGVPLKLPVFSAARASGIPVYGENDYAYYVIQKLWKTKPFIIGVTGTDGKSTTVDITYHILDSVPGITAVPCGNYGKPLSDLVFDSLKEAELPVLVTELSSFQLEPLTFFRPHVAMILNLAEDHMDRYDSLEEYLNAKLKICMRQGKDDLLAAPPWILEKAFRYEEEIGKSEMVRKISAYPYSESSASHIFHVKEGTVIFRNREIIRTDEFPLKGIHNLMNLQYALIAWEETHVRNRIQPDYDLLRKSLSALSTLECRMEDLGTVAGIQFINDSKATTVQSVAAAIESQGDRPVHLLLGGRHKGLDFSPLRKYSKNVTFYPFGEAREIIAEHLGVSSVYFTMEEAFSRAAENALQEKEKNPVVILSPACSSYDAYRSFIERGRHFREIVSAFRKKHS